MNLWPHFLVAGVVSSISCPVLFKVSTYANRSSLPRAATALIGFIVGFFVLFAGVLTVAAPYLHD